MKSIVTSFHFVFCLCLLTLATIRVASASTPTALIYMGPGSCEEDCSQSAAQMAQLAGFTTRYVGPNETDPTIFSSAALWIQPGGQSSVAAAAMNEALKNNLREFIARGGGYVGFCAGGFIATEWIADRGVKGFGILPGTNALYNFNSSGILPIQTAEGAKQLYWEGGPYFKLNPGDVALITGYYPDGSIASLNSTFGLGRVSVTGLHPEAPQQWRDYYKLNDSDGLDFAVATNMILWVTQKNTVAP